MVERTEVVIVGSRCAGSATAIALARRGRSVIALDGASFPSDTLSTHLFFPCHWAELEALGARDRVLELKPPLHTHAGLGTKGTEVLGPYFGYRGFAAGACVRRPGLDDAVSPIEAAAYQWFADRPDGPSEILDVFSRGRLPEQVFTPGRVLRWVSSALRRPGPGRAAVWRTVRRDVAREAARRKEAALFARRRAASAAMGDS